MRNIFLVVLVLLAVVLVGCQKDNSANVADVGGEQNQTCTEQYIASLQSGVSKGLAVPAYATCLREEENADYYADLVEGRLNNPDFDLVE